MFPSPSTVILANGTFPESEQALRILRNAQHIVCCDGAINKMAAHRITPTVIVGDCDSMTAEDKEQWKEILSPDHSEEYNDLQKALKYCLRNHLDHIVLLGCEGLRDDHFIANISIMATYSNLLDLTMVTNHGIFNVIQKTTTLASIPGQQVSVFTKDEQLPLTFHGLKYPVESRCFKHLWEGSLNEALGEDFTIELHRKGVVLVYRAID